ncbi:VIT1/CCC1 transporter family protein, partial [candidate division WWE3 bacterium]|nr:VIT1/CCC1 transporter family protein [candidate division WWE3 bacterium]
SPTNSAIVVGLSSFVGSLIPLSPFFAIRSVPAALFSSLAISVIALFFVGFIKAKRTMGNPYKSGLQITLIGIASAVIGFLLGKMLGGVNI